MVCAAFDNSIRNPFTPTFGQIPPYMAGREEIIREIEGAFNHGVGNPNLCTILIGARGTGKTALLGYLGDKAESQGWVTVNVNALSGMLEDIYEQAQHAAAHLIDCEQGKKLTGVNIAALGGLSWENESSVQRNWRSRMDEIFEQLSRTDTGLLITVDEVDPALEEMVHLVATYQLFVRERKKVALLMAGLPHKVSGLISGKSTSFVRRAAQYRLGNIPGYEVAEAFRLTLESAGKTISDEALEVAVGAIEGFPFMFQLVGYRSWNASGACEEISVTDVQRGVALAQAELASRIFDATFAELSNGDKAFLFAMVEMGGSVSRDDLASKLGKTSSYVSTYKKRLLDAGVIEEERRGILSFALPGFRDYLSGQM